MIITEEEFFDYIDCPTKYEMKHIHNLDIPENKTMRKLISEVTNYFFASLYNQKVPSINTLKSRWDMVCENNTDFIDPKKSLEGLGIIVNLFNYAADKQLTVLSFNSTYNIDTNNKNRLVGVIENPIITNDGETLELLVPYHSNKIPKTIELDTKLKFTIDATGFYESNGERLEGINVLLLKRMEEFQTFRNYMDKERLSYAVDGVVKGIEAGAFYPRESVFCDSCGVRALCKFWTGQK